MALARVMVHTVAEPAVMVTLPAGVPPEEEPTLTDRCSACSWPALTLAADRDRAVELGRTSRSQLMVVGELTDSAGKKHKVSYTTNNQNEQMIALVSPALCPNQPSEMKVASIIPTSTSAPIRIASKNKK